MTDERCKHDLIVDQCGDCNPPPGTQFDQPDGATTIAMFAGRCPDCREPVEPDDVISFDADFGWVHKGCAS